MRFVFIDWLDAVVDWQPPGSPIDGVCRSCEESRLRTMGVLSVLPHELLHLFVTDVERRTVVRGSALGDASVAELDVHSDVEAILPEVAELWEQHASPRMRAWIADHIDDVYDVILITEETTRRIRKPNESQSYRSLVR